MFTAEQRYVLTLLQQLPPAQRTVAALYYDGLTIAEMAELTGKPSGTVRSHLRHARQSLKEVIASEQPAPAAPAWDLAPVMTAHSDDELAELHRYVIAQLGGAAAALTSSTDTNAVLQVILSAPRSCRLSPANADKKPGHQPAGRSP